LIATILQLSSRKGSVNPPQNDEKNPWHLDEDDKGSSARRSSVNIYIIV
jgi:hypothetical protein